MEEEVILLKGYIADFTHIKDTQLVAAFSEALLRTVEDDEIILQMSYQHRPNISLGVDDTMIDDFNKGLNYYRRNGYSVTVRNSGGRSVVNDPGILNFSLIMKANQTGTERYHMFFDFMEKALEPLNLDFKLGMISGAYCPGTYDISINGKKVAGTAQRKIGDNALVGCYLSVNGNQMERSEVVKKFYEIINGPIEVNPYKMTTLQDEALREITIPNVTTMLIAYFRTLVDSISFVDVQELEESEAVKTAKQRIIDQDKRYLSTKK